MNSTAGARRRTAAAAGCAVALAACGTPISTPHPKIKVLCTMAGAPAPGYKYNYSLREGGEPTYRFVGLNPRGEVTQFEATYGPLATGYFKFQMSSARLPMADAAYIKCSALWLDPKGPPFPQIASAGPFGSADADGVTMEFQVVPQGDGFGID